MYYSIITNLSQSASKFSSEKRGHKLKENFLKNVFQLQILFSIFSYKSVLNFDF